MSKASELARLKAESKFSLSIVEDQETAAFVTDVGKLRLYSHYKAGIISAEKALEFRDWLTETFDEPVKVTKE